MALFGSVLGVRGCGLPGRRVQGEGEVLVGQQLCHSLFLTKHTRTADLLPGLEREKEGGRERGLGWRGKRERERERLACDDTMNYFRI